MFYYKAVLNGSCQGQDIRNILYYRDGLGFNWANQLFGGSQVVAEELLQEVWPKMKALLPNEYRLDSIDVYPHNEAFQLLVQVPYHMPVLDQNGARGDESAGIATCMNIRFNLEPTGALNGIWPPKFGYIAFGPLPKIMLAESGLIHLESADEERVDQLCAALSANLETIDPLPASLYPIRVRHNRILGGLAKWSSYADVSSASILPRVSWRRSRMPEA